MYPKINYIGNKRKLADWLVSIMPLKNGTVVDAFAGGCSMSYALKKAGYQVFANDVLYSGFVISKAIIENDHITLKKSRLEVKQPAPQNEKIRACLENKLYFSSEMPELEALVFTAESLGPYEKEIFLSLLRRAMIRKLPYSRMNVPWNQIQKLRDEDYSYQKYGRKRAYHNQSFLSHMVSNLDEYNNAVFDNGKKCLAYNLDVLSLAEIIGPSDIVYLDPPYPSTMNNYDAFYGLFDEVFGHQTSRHLDLTDKNTFLPNIEKVIKAYSTKTRYIVLSQNTKSKPGSSEMIAMLSKYGDVKVARKNHNYQVTGKDNKASSSELAYILKLS